MTREDWKHIIISVLLGAFMAFISTLFEGLAQAFKAHAPQILDGAATTTAYLFQKHIS